MSTMTQERQDGKADQSQDVWQEIQDLKKAQEVQATAQAGAEATQAAAQAGLMATVTSGAVGLVVGMLLGALFTRS
jgi:hypothetical protein